MKALYHCSSLRVLAAFGLLLASLTPAHSQEAIDAPERVKRSPQVVLDALLNHYGKRYAGSYLQALALRVRVEEQGRDAVAPILAPAFEKAAKIKSGGQLSGRLAFVPWAADDPRARQRVLEAANLGLDKHGSAKAEMPFHNEMSDAVFMACPILCEAGRLTGNTNYTTAAWNHLGLVRERCLRKDGLYRHSPLNEAAWGRGNGFPALGLSMCLDTVPADWPQRAAMRNMLVAHLTALLPHQDANGMWHQVIDHPDSYAEFTCTCMISVAAIRAMREGWIDQKQWRPAIEQSWKAVKGRISLDGATLNGCCTGTGKQKSLEAYFKRKEIHGRDERGGAMALLFAFEMKKGIAR